MRGRVITIDPAEMDEGFRYGFNYGKERFVAVKRKDGTIEVYEVLEGVKSDDDEMERTIGKVTVPLDREGT